MFSGLAAPAVDPNSVYGEPPAVNSEPTLQQQRNVNDQNAIIILRLESFKPMGTRKKLSI